MSQGYSSENYVITQFSLDEGLPQSSVNDIIQSEDGYIWLATYGGLVRFDGLTFTTFNRSNTPGIVDDRIIKLFEDADGGIWLFNELETSVLYRFKDGKVQKFPLNKGGGTVFRMYNDTSGRLWLTAYNTLYLFQGNSFFEFEIEKVNDTKGIQADGSTHLPIIIANRLIFIGPEKVLEIEDLNNKISQSIISVKKYPSNSDSLILATISGQFYYYTNGNISKLSINEDVGERTFNTFEKSKRRLFAEIYAKIIVWNGSFFESFNPIKHEKNLSYKAILEDSEGNIWMGTDANGLFKLKPAAIEMIDQSKGLTTESMLSITMLNNGVALLSSNCGGIFEWRNGQAYQSKVQDYYQSGCNWSVFQDSKNRVWIGGSGLYMTESLDQMGIFLGTEEGFTNAGVYAMMEDSEGNIWIASSEGIYIYNGEEFFKKYQISDGLYYQDARVLVQDNSGKIWVGTGLGLNTIDVEKQVVSKIPLTKSVEGSVSFSQPYIRAIYQDEDNDMWIGTYGEGLFRIRNDSLKRLTVEDGLFDNVISHIIEDKYGYFWMGSNRGITRVKRDDLNDYIEGKIESFNYSSFGSSDGMNSAETNSGFQPSTFTDNEGRIYFPTVSGVAIVDPEKVSKNAVSPPVYIERLRTEEGELSKKESLTFSYDNAFLEINYTGINFSDPDKVEFRYKMIGLNDNWIDVRNQRSAIYSKIPPGNYTFQVTAANSDGVWNTEGASFKIIVTPPFWDTYWFYGLIFMLLIGLAYSIMYYRTLKLKEENERKKRFAEELIDSQEQERRRIASELHDGLGQQILVIKNRVELARLQLENSSEISEQLDEIQHSALISINDVRNISHALRPVLLEKFGLTDALIELCEQLQKSSSIEWSYHIDDINKVILKNREINFYRVIQESINNILKHSKATEASIMVRKINNEVQAVVWDNGKGFDSSPAKLTNGLGVLGMKERVESLGGTIFIKSTPFEATVIKINIPSVTRI